MAEDNSGRQLHGVELPINGISKHSFGSESSRFPNAISDWIGTPLTLRERRMIALMGEITDKPEWEHKVLNDEIVARWKAEAMSLNANALPERVLTEKAFEYCVEELRDYASNLGESEMVPAIDADALVLKSDTRITREMKAALKAAVVPLENIEESEKDWHPGSDQKVLDVVHPSLFPLLYGRSTVLPDGETVPLFDCDLRIGEGTVVPVPKDEHVVVDSFPGLSSWNPWQRSGHEQHFYSKKYQWLPCEVAFKGEEKVEITSYINNLHPRQHRRLYTALEDVIARVVPMWDAVLDRSDDHPQPRDDADAEWIEPDGERPTAENEDELDEDDIYELNDDWMRDNRTLSMPDLENEYGVRATSKPSGIVNLRDDFEEQGLQIIVKLANIHLTPERPNYDGGSWHIEGQLNEHICASALFYYDSSNITDSFLSFREATSVEHLGDKPYEQGDFDHLERTFGIENDGPAIQELGHVNTREGRLIAFPNVLQHRVEPFSLADRSKPGHRKLVALFLVDPYIRIPSTAHVPPQQKSWWQRMLYRIDRVADLPPEVAEGIVDTPDSLPISLVEATRIREELMDERRLFVADVETRYQQEQFSFCEH